MKTLSNCILMAFLGLAQLPAQVNPAEGTQKFQESAQLNDERVKVFMELEAKAALNDGKAMEQVGRYYCDGRFPVLQNLEKGKDFLLRGASLGDVGCATRMWEYTNKNGDENDPEHVIETQKWHLIWTSLARVNSEFVRRPDEVSEASWAEAKSRAVAFLAGVKSFTPATATQPMRKNSVASDDSSGFRKPRLPSLKFETLSLFDVYRKNVCSAYMKAAMPIYNKGENASSEEKMAFTVAAAELVRLQSYIGKTRRLDLGSKVNGAMRAVNSEKMNDCYAKMSSAKIATTLPVTRTELNEASIYINALGQLMQLPVSLGD